ncbi:serine/threonine-protein kinase [Antrihabitans cavernicola]|uniref:non-specific serine/threonine protein kinase n=1 Tax=Antrihabitans cavernicola TaxID=2495913 RepID=A0A5A7SC41_9NOCA|nr:serine/threonine-protein kinase [Spelaeibacter cavernicola]KAA0022722.1 serine/threonine protein kinase [Spelaeibacter cavernicola]
MTEHSGPGVGPDFLVAGRYRLQSKLGGGGMGAVWLARDTLLDRDVAIKQIVSTTGLTTAEAEELRRRAIREGRIAAKLSHNHAIGMYDVTVEGGEPWLVMEYLPSRSLAQVLNLTDALPPLEVAQIGAQVADALSTAHAAGIVHRDIKPGNILVADRGRNVGMVKISDFGISRAKGEHESDRAGVITGTPAYFAPEVARGNDPTEKSDVFSLGATLYTITEGQPPFGINEDSLELLHRVAKAEIIAPQRSGPITDALLHMLEPDPAKRPTMTEARDALAVVAAGQGGSIEYLLGAPVQAVNGGIPPWAQRSASYLPPHANRLSGRTQSGLPAMPQNTPLRAVRSPRIPKRTETRRPEFGRPEPQHAPLTTKTPGKNLLPLAIALGMLLVLILVIALVIGLA